MPATPPPSDPAELIGWLADREAIRDLVSSFGVAVDDKDRVGYADNFTEEAVLQMPFGTFEGRAAIAEMKGPPSHWRTQHMFGNIVIDLDGDSAVVRAYTMSTHVFDPVDATKKAHAGGWYAYDVVRTDAGWRFARVKLVIVWQDERPMLPPGVAASPPRESATL